MRTNQLLSESVEKLLAWYPAHARDLPWRQDQEPYHVWLSEIMLQQTRVEAVKGYYRRFCRHCRILPPSLMRPKNSF